MTFSTKEMKSILTFSLLIGLLASCEKKEEEWGEIDDGVYEINQVIQFDFNSTKKVDVVDYTFRVTVSEKQKRIFFIVEQKNYDSEKTELYALEMQDEQGNILFTLDKIYNEKMEGNYDVTVLSDKEFQEVVSSKVSSRDLRIIFCKILKMWLLPQFLKVAK